MADQSPAATAAEGVTSITHRTFARVGLFGNPSDQYYGKSAPRAFAVHGCLGHLSTSDHVEVPPGVWYDAACHQESSLAFCGCLWTPLQAALSPSPWRTSRPRYSNKLGIQQQLAAVLMVVSNSMAYASLPNVAWSHCPAPRRMPVTTAHHSSTN